MRILSVVGARPNFMKVAPIIKQFSAHPIAVTHQLVHTGQHYDERMSGSFFNDLGLPKPDINLAVGSAGHAEQTARVMLAVEPVLRDFAPDIVIVVGDVNSTLACALTAKKLGFRVAHVEAGLRSGDMAMPEEINRLCTDAISDVLFTTDSVASENLVRENVAEGRIHFVGNVMIDSLLSHLPAAQKLDFPGSLGLKPRGYATLTLHRPSNVDNAERLGEILCAVSDSLPDLPIIFPAHPRTRQRIIEFELSDHLADDPQPTGIFAIEPLGYLEFLGLNHGARLILTDSGGLQEEATILGVPCVTLRDNTERPITVSAGTNRLAGTTRVGILKATSEALRAERNVLDPPEKWDGQAAKRIVDVLSKRYA